MKLITLVCEWLITIIAYITISKCIVNTIHFVIQNEKLRLKVINRCTNILKSEIGLNLFKSVMF